MKIYDVVKKCLEDNPSARERRFRDRYLTMLILKKHGYEGYSVIPANEQVEICRDYVSYERTWRDVLQKESHLRGQDHSDGKILAQKFQLEDLKLEVGYHKDIKQLSLIK